MSRAPGVGVGRKPFTVGLLHSLRRFTFEIVNDMGVVTKQ